jgi:hypothetical protein
MEKISLRAELIYLSARACRLVIALAAGCEIHHFNAPDVYECLRAFSGN